MAWTSLEFDVFDKLQTTLDNMHTEMVGIRAALGRIANALQPKQEAPKPAPADAQLSLPITALGVSTRAETALITNRCKSIADVTALSRFKLNLTWHCGKKTIREIEEALAKRGLKLRLKNLVVVTRRVSPTPAGTGIRLKRLCGQMA